MEKHSKETIQFREEIKEIYPQVMVIINSTILCEMVVFVRYDSKVPHCLELAGYTSPSRHALLR